MIYFDNAATTFPKPARVIHALQKCVSEYCGNPGRSSHDLSVKCSEKIYETREEIANFLSYNYPENIVFTQNASYALNMAIKTSVKRGEHILISDNEHNSVLRPLEKLKRDGLIEYTVLNSESIKNEDIEKHITSKTKFIVCNLISNVTGEEISLKSLYNLKQKYNLKLIVDASQMIGHKKINLSDTPCDILCAPSHKGLFGIQGAGFCVFCDEEERESFIEGGSGSESFSPLMPRKLPEHFEAGTLPTPAIVSLGEGIKFIQSVGINKIEEKLESLTKKAYEVLSDIKNLKIYGAENGIISFTIAEVPSHLIADDLNKAKIFVRSGIHCAPLVHKKLGTEYVGTVRASFSYFNNLNEINKFYKELKRISNKYK